jgi:mono/diheme cytochrome c family protein
MRAALLLTLMSALTAPLLAQAPQASDAAPPGSVENGKKLFVDRACYMCHGLVAHSGGEQGPRIAGRVPPWPAFAKYVRAPTNQMIPYTEKVLANQELADIYAWLKALPPPPPVSSIPQLRR